jgi:hypothetical protein
VNQNEKPLKKWIMKKYALIMLSFIMSSIPGIAQTIARFEVRLPESTNGLEVPVSVSLKDIKALPSASSMALVITNGTSKTYFPFQLSADKTLSWMVKAGEKKSLSFQLIKTKMQAENFSTTVTRQRLTEANKIVTIDKDGSYTISSHNRKFLSYVHKKVDPPAGVDAAFGRSGFIHPLWAPHGQELTRIQPKDHYHHYGIWNPWTHVLFEGDTVDFWNLGSKQATVRFAKLISKTDGPVFSEFKVLHEHIVFKKDGGEKKALNEIQTIRVYNTNSKDYYIVDFTSELSCATSSPFHIVAYRYAGFGWRATEYWTKDNSEMLTSEGKTRDSTDGSKARWCIVYGELPGNDEGGAIMLSHPDNHNHPEPLRIWDKKSNGGRGDVFANFAPTKDKDWILEPGKTYILKYRLVVFNGKMDAARAEAAWQYFAKPAEIGVSR